MLLRLMSLSLCVLLENRVLTCCPLPCWKRMVFWLAVGTNHPFQMQHPLNDRRACEGAAERLMQTWPWPAWRDQTVWECLVGRPAWSAQTACEPEARDTRWLTWRCLPWSGQTASDQQARSLSFPPNPPLLLCLSSIQGEAQTPPLKIPTERVLYRADTGQSIWAQTGGSGSLWRGEAGGSGQLGESSSGSEQDGLFSAGGASAGGGRRSQGQGRRNLRKTKSRGKGKGAGTLTPTLLLDELSFTVHQPPKGVGEGQDTAMEPCPQADD